MIKNVSHSISAQNRVCNMGLQLSVHPSSANPIPLDIELTVPYSITTDCSPCGETADTKQETADTEQTMTDIEQIVTESLQIILYERFSQGFNQRTFSSHKGLFCLNDEFFGKGDIKDIVKSCTTQIAIDTYESSVTVPYSYINHRFMGHSKDGIRYTACAAVYYQKTDDLDASDASDADSEAPLSMVKAPAYAYLEEQANLFIMDWETKTLGDYIETYDRHSPKDQSIVWSNSRDNHKLDLVRYQGITVLRTEIQIESESWDTLIETFTTKQKVKAEKQLLYGRLSLGMLGSVPLSDKARSLVKVPRGSRDAVKVCNQSFRSSSDTLKEVLLFQFIGCLVWILLQTLENEPIISACPTLWYSLLILAFGPIWMIVSMFM